MPRAPNFNYQNPMGDIGSSLVRAIFGDPQAAQAQQKAQAEAELRDAQARQANEHAELYRAQTTGQTGQNTASNSLPALIGRLSAPPQTVPTLDDPGFLEGVGTAPPVPTADEQFRSNLGPTVAALAQMSGDKVDPRQVIGTLASFFGGDEMARRGLVAQGNTPGAAFALTPDRADDIAGQGYNARQSLAESVAGINNRDDVPVANIQAGASRYGADVRASASRYGADARATTAGEVAVAKAATAREAAERKEAARTAASRARPISVSAFKKLDSVVADQLAARGLQSPALEDGTPGPSRLDTGVTTWIRTRAIENFRQSGNFLDAADKAIAAAVEASERQKAARTVRRAPPASQGRGAGEQRLTVEQASKLPKGTRFVGLDGIVRWRQ